MAASLRCTRSAWTMLRSDLGRRTDDSTSGQPKTPANGDSPIVRAVVRRRLNRGGLSPRPRGHVRARDLDAVGNVTHMHFSLLDTAGQPIKRIRRARDQQQPRIFQQFGSTAYTVSTWVMPLVIAVTFHEASHGYVARLCGEDTAWRLWPRQLQSVQAYRPVRDHS